MAWRAMLRDRAGAKNADNAIRSESTINNPQRGVYQPLMDNIPIYDLSDEEIEEEERSRVPLLIVIALVVLAAFAGVVWLAYNQGVARGRAGTSLVIEAPNSPVRVAPANAGSPAPFTNLKVHSQPIPPDQEAQKSALAAPQVKAPVTTEAPPVRLSPAEPPARLPGAGPPPPTPPAHDVAPAPGTPRAAARRPARGPSPGANRTAAGAARSSTCGSPHGAGHPSAR